MDSKQFLPERALRSSVIVTLLCDLYVGEKKTFLLQLEVVLRMPVRYYRVH